MPQNALQAVTGEVVEKVTDEFAVMSYANVRDALALADEAGQRFSPLLRQWRAVPNLVPVVDASKPDVLRSAPALDVEFMSGGKVRALVAQNREGMLALWSSSSLGVVEGAGGEKAVEHFASDLRLQDGSIVYTTISGRANPPAAR